MEEIQFDIILCFLVVHFLLQYNYWLLDDHLYLYIQNRPQDILFIPFSYQTCTQPMFNNLEHETWNMHHVVGSKMDMNECVFSN
jgi:hypothetical protein